MQSPRFASPLGCAGRCAGLAWLPLLLLPGLVGCGSKTPPSAPPVVVRYQAVRLAEAAPSHRRAQYVGILRGDRETDLGFRVAGTLELIGPPGDPEGWREGTTVTRGQELARLVRTDFVSAVADAQAWTNVHDRAFLRTEKLFSQGTVSSEELDLARARRDSARAALRKAEQALADATLSAPWDGVLLARLASAGETILPGRIVLRIADLTTLSLEIGVPDTVVNAIHPGQALPLEVSSFEGRPFRGLVSEVGVAAKEGSRLFKVALKVPNDDPTRRLRAGMSATVDFARLQPPPPGAVAVPLSALVTAASGDARRLAVFVLEAGGVVREREIETGDLIGSSVVVTRGLTAGERVVTFGAANLADGMAVDARPEASPGGRP